MQPLFWSSDLSIMPLLRALEKLGGGGEWTVLVGAEKREGLQASDLWRPLLEKVAQETRFGRVGLMGERGDGILDTWITSEGLPILESGYQASSKRAEEKIAMTCFATQGLRALAYEGLSGSVEFRRLARNSIRKAKMSRVDSLVFLDPLFGETSTKKVLQHIAGSQIKVYTLDDVVDLWLGKVAKGTAHYRFEVRGEDLVFVQQRAESILERKFRDEAFVQK